MPRYDYRCQRCNQVSEVALPITSDPKATLACGADGCAGRCVRVVSGLFQFNMKPVSSSFPYVSSRLPFGLKGETHVGPLGKTLVKNRQHKDRLYKEHRFVAE